MANREELGLIRGARAGRADAQLELGKLYLFGSAGLPKSLPTALHWLDRAAQQDCAEAWQLIGSYIPFEVAQQSARPLALWYERACDDGVARAGLVLARLLLADAGTTAAARSKALGALESAAQAGLAEAQWLFAQLQEQGALAAPSRAAPAQAAPSGAPQERERWLRRAADGGVVQAQSALLQQAWEAGQWAAFLRRALPLARASVQASAANKAALRLNPEEALLLSRCAQLLSDGQVQHAVEPAEILRFWELAAHEGERDAQLALGLWLARMQVDGKRTAVGIGAANFKKAIRWLTLAGEQGLAPAWYALSRIYSKPEFSQRNVVDAQAFLERAADMGYRDAQLECGNSAWRARREVENNDVRAVYWLQKAAAQGCAQAGAMLAKIAPRAPAPALPGGGAWSTQADLIGCQPLLAARIELAALFGLSRAEALLLDVKQADQGHCLVVDIRSSYGRSKRRLVLLETAHERQALDRIVRLFDNIDCGPNGPEGNYRQRLYRFKTHLLALHGDAGASDATEVDELVLAA